MSVAEWATIVVSLLALGISIASYRHASSIKRLDLRLDARKARSSLLQKFEDVEGLLPQARRSHLAVASALGSLRSGAITKWEKECDQHTDELAKLKGQLTVGDGAYDRMSDKQLELEISKLHVLSVAVEAIGKVYERSVADDDRDRDHIRREMENRRPLGPSGRT